MPMAGYKLLYLTSLIIFTFGALTFSVLTLFYWRERRVRAQPRGRVFPVFTVVCAASFLLNLVLRMVTAVNADSSWVAVLIVALSLATGCLPPLLVHLLLEEEKSELPGRRAWRWVLGAFYLAASAGALLRGLCDADLWNAEWSERVDNLPPLMLGAAGALGLALQFSSRRHPGPAERRHNLWIRLLLCLMLLGTVLNLAQAGSLVSLFPDYLVLGFFCVTLYYKERLIFFDLLIKRGAFFALGLVGLILFFLAAPGAFQSLAEDWSRPWIAALLLTPFWLLGPWLYGRLGRAIDHAWLRRRYSAPDAERRFVSDVQSAATEQELQSRATESLAEIFQTSAEVEFTATGIAPAAEDGSLLAELEHQGKSLGRVALRARLNSVPFLSDDRRLLHSLARTLGVVLENVRFREQQQKQEEREQQLRWLASRAELKALRAQINPHFLFNALNAIAGLIPLQPQLAEETVEQLAEVFRYTLRKSEKEWMRVDEEVEFVLAYLRVEQARFGERLHVEVDVDPAAGAILIPAMSIQPLVENAIKHGVSAIEGRGTVGLRAVVQGDMLGVTVSDNGPGFPDGFTLAGPDARTGSGHGLRNIAERLRGYYSESAQLSCENDGGGARVVLRIPRQPVTANSGGG
ncbi:MAG TPA: histidine kinase [Bryobacteraceae bacterium]|nr:histidine kinase [Bryobacteraceae bacterium]